MRIKFYHPYKVIIILTLVLGFWIPCHSQSVNIHGKITNQNGQPLGGVFVGLVKAGLIDTTDANGNYALAGEPLSLSSKKPTNELSFSYSQNLLNVTTPINQSISIKLFDLKGRLISLVFSGNLTKGLHTFTVSSRAPSSTIIAKLSTVNSEKTLLFTINTRHTGQPSKSLSKKNAVTDNLITEKFGYVNASLSLDRQQGEQNIVLLWDPAFEPGLSTMTTSTSQCTGSGRYGCSYTWIQEKICSPEFNSTTLTYSGKAPKDKPILFQPYATNNPATIEFTVDSIPVDKTTTGYIVNTIYTGTRTFNIKVTTLDSTFQKTYHFVFDF